MCEESRAAKMCRIDWIDVSFNTYSERNRLSGKVLAS